MKEGWEYKKLGEIATDMYRGSGIKRDQVTNEGFPCVRYGEIYTTYNVAFDSCVSHTKEEYISSPKYFEFGDLLFAITGESVEDIGKTIAYLGNERCLCGGDIICMKHHQNPKYLAYALSTPDAIRQKGLGKTKLKVVHTNAPALKAISIPLAPLSEQQSIVDYLDSAFAKIDAMKANAEKALNEAKALFQASLKEMLEPKEGWEEKTLKEICKVINGRAYSKDEMLKQGKYRLLRVGNFFTNDNWYYSDLELEEDKYCDNGDLLYAWSASFGPRIWNGEKVIYHYHIWKMVCSEEIDKYFLCYWLDSDELKKQTMTNLHGATMAHITKGIIEAAHVSFPLLSEQQSIVTTLDSLKSKVDRLQENYNKISQECDALKQAILRQVFE